MSDNMEDRSTGTQEKVAEIVPNVPDIIPSPDTSQIICGPEAVRVLNCVAALNYQEARCVSLLVALRKCCESKVSFHNAITLHPSDKHRMFSLGKRSTNHRIQIFR